MLSSWRRAIALTCLLSWHFVFFCVGIQAAELDPARLWLPSSSAHLRPYLHMATEDAARDPECAEILYARLNEYRTLYEEPTFTVLCRRDYNSTFNKIYPITALEPDYNGRVAQGGSAIIDASTAGEGLESLRQLLLAPDASQPASHPDVDADIRSGTTPVAQVPVMSRDGNRDDLDLELSPVSEVISDPTLELDLQELVSPASSSAPEQ